MKFLSFVLEHPQKTLLFIGLTTCFFCLSIVDLKYDFTIEQLFAKNKEETEAYFDFQEEFSREDNVILLVHELPKNLNNTFIDSVNNLVSRINTSSYFLDVISLADIYKKNSHSSNDKEEYEHISSGILNMISSDSTYGSIWLKLSDDYNTFKKRSDVIDFLKSCTSDFEWNWTYSGIPIVRNTYVEYMIQDNIKFIPPVALILVFALSFLFRHWIYVILPLITVLITALWILGIMSITGRGLNVMTYMVPTLLFIIGVSDSIHLLTRLNIYLKKNKFELQMKPENYMHPLPID